MSDKGGWLIPGAIVFAGLVIAFSVYSIQHHTAVTQAGDPSAVRPVNPATDHIVGNPTAPVIFIEYADIDSEYSKQFEPVMEQVMQTYGSGGSVAWVYRDFPLIDIDATSEEDAEAAECVAAQGGAQNGTTNFFKFIDALETAAPDQNQFDPKGYDPIATQLGLSVADLNNCLSARTEEKHVEADYENALAVGADGSPFTVLLVKGEKPAVISGALPYEVMTQIIDGDVAKVLGASATSTDTSGN
jgi:protein-disulfide isomerase